MLKPLRDFYDWRFPMFVPAYFHGEIASAPIAVGVIIVREARP
jgi:hypothetical protein